MMETILLLLVSFGISNCLHYDSLPKPVLQIKTPTIENGYASLSCELQSNISVDLKLEIKIDDVTIENCTEESHPHQKVVCGLKMTKEFHKKTAICVLLYQVLSEPQTLLVHHKPEFAFCPKKVFLVEHTDEFTCNATGYPTPEVLCLKKHNAYRPRDMSKPSRSMAGQYDCTANNSVGEAFQNVQIDVEYKPDEPIITITPATGHREGISISLKCLAYASPGAEYHWEVPSNAPVTYNKESSMIMISNASAVHNGKYTCMPKNKHGSAKKEHILTLMVAPHLPIIQVYPTEPIVEGNSFNLTCHSSGYPVPTMTWSIPNKADVIYAHDHSSILVSKANLSHGGRYSCTATNQLGSKTGYKDITIIKNGSAVGPSYSWLLLVLIVIAVLLAHNFC